MSLMQLRGVGPHDTSGQAANPIFERNNHD